MLDGFHFRYRYHCRGIIMEAAFTALLPTLGGPAIAILIVIFMYLKITSARKETKAERDKDSQELHDKLLKHDFEISNIKGELGQQRNLNSDLSNQINILSQSVAKFSVAVDMLSESVKEIREELRNVK